MTKEEAIAFQRDLAIKANFFDSIVRIPFTKQGVGADPVVGAVPGIGDFAGLLMAGYAIGKAVQLGVPMNKLVTPILLAIADVPIGLVPGAGDVVDVFIRPSRRAVLSLNEHLAVEYGITSTEHIDRPIMHRFLERKKAESNFWHNSTVGWVTLHVPDIIGAMLIIGFFSTIWNMISGIINWFH